MADEHPRADEVTNLTPEQVAAGLREGRMLLVDVREPNETAVESYPEAVVVPLSVSTPRQFRIRKARKLFSPVGRDDGPKRLRSPRRTTASPTRRISQAVS